MKSGGGVGWKGGEYKIHSSQKRGKEIKIGHLCPRHGRCSPWLSIFSIDQETLFLYRNEESFVIFVFCFHHDQNGDLHPSHLKETLLWTWTPSCWLNLGGWSELTIKEHLLLIRIKEQHIQDTKISCILTYP